MTPLPNAVTFPGPHLPAPWGFEFSCPEGWATSPAPGALAIVSAPEELDGFRPNLVIGSAKVRRSIDLRVVAVRTLAAAGHQGDDAELELQRIGNFHGRPTYLQAISVSIGEPPRRMARLFAFFFGPAAEGDEVVDLYTLCGTCPDEASAEVAPKFLDIVASFRFTAPLTRRGPVAAPG